MNMKLIGEGSFKTVMNNVMNQSGTFSARKCGCDGPDKLLAGRQARAA